MPTATQGSSKYQLIKDAQLVRVEGKGKNAKLVPIGHKMVAGGQFTGVLRFLKIPNKGFVPVVKVVGRRNERVLGGYHLRDNVTAVAPTSSADGLYDPEYGMGDVGNVYGILEGNSYASGYTDEVNPYAVQAGLLKGHGKRNPYSENAGEMHEAGYGVNPFEVSAGQDTIWGLGGEAQSNAEGNPYHVTAGEYSEQEGGEINPFFVSAGKYNEPSDGLGENPFEVEAGHYNEPVSEAIGTTNEYGVAAGQAFEEIATPNPFGIRAGMVAGKRGSAPNIFEPQQTPYNVNDGEEYSGVSGYTDEVNPYAVQAGLLKGKGKRWAWSEQGGEIHEAGYGVNPFEVAAGQDTIWGLGGEAQSNAGGIFPYGSNMTEGFSMLDVGGYDDDNWFDATGNGRPATKSCPCAGRDYSDPFCCFSGADGDQTFWQKLGFGKKKEERAKAQADAYAKYKCLDQVGKMTYAGCYASKLAEFSTKTEFTPEELQVLHTASGSTQPLRDWVKSDEAKGLIGSIAQFGAAILGRGTTQTAQPTGGVGYDQLQRTDDEDKKRINPLTIGIIAGTVVIAGVVTYLIIRKKK